jgi:hypothetical protein
LLLIKKGKVSNKNMAELIEFNVKWQGKALDLSVPRWFTVLQLKEQIHAVTKVGIYGQKLVGLLPKGKVPPDDAKLENLEIKSPHKFMVLVVSMT